MVVLSAAICNKAGKAVLARQFVPMSRLRIEGLLAGFPKLLESESEHTFVETENVRYVYQPMEELYLLLVTNKQSNIMEDLDTLRLLAKLIPEYCSGQSEEAITDNAYELVFAFDEVIAVGYKESVTLQQVRKYTEMDSHEEKLQKIIMESKVNEARDEMRRKAESIDKQKQEIKRLQQAQGNFGGGGHGGRYTGMGGGGGGMGGNGMGGGDSGFGNADDDYERSHEITPKSYSKPKPKPKKTSSKRKTGLQLGKKKKEENFFEAIAQEAKEQLPTNLQVSHAHLAQQAAGTSVPPDEAISIKIHERLSVALERDGGLKRMEVKGECTLCIIDPDYAKIILKTTGAPRNSPFSFRIHPKIDKQRWKDGTLALKDASKSFPVGHANKSGILKWRLQTSDESLTPLTFNAWPSEENGTSVMSVDFQMEHEDLVLRDVVVSIPCPGIGEEPEINNCDGEHTFDRSDSVLSWHIEQINPGDSGSLEFTCDEIDSDDFYPLQISFHSENTFSGLEILDVIDAESEESFDSNCEYSLIAEKYMVQ